MARTQLRGLDHQADWLHREERIYAEAHVERRHDWMGGVSE